MGSNLGDRMDNLLAALVALRQIASPGEPVLTAPVYQTEPRFCPPGSPDFLNTVVEIGFDGSPLELLAQTRAIEKQLGRTRGAERNAPRTIDIDLLYLGDEILEGDELTLPHPRIGERRFVLQPLADIRPDLVLPGHSKAVAEILAGLQADESQLVLMSGPARL
jgi:2-amino-4-hydroxy-6-hydroxymethyldihydropteridine diphosphokinase